MLSRFCCRLQQGPGSEIPLPAMSACALCVPVCHVAPGFFGRGSGAGQDPASLLFVAPVLSAQSGSWCPSRRCRAASACLFLSFSLSLHPKGFPTTSQKCLIGHRICPVLFCLAVLAWQAGELGCRQLSCGAGVGGCRWDRPGLRRRSATWRRCRGTAGTSPQATLLPPAPARLAGPAPSAPGFSPFPFPWQSWLGSSDPPPGMSRGPSVAESR